MGCARLQPAPDATHLSEQARSCAGGERGIELCVADAFAASARGDRRATGQLLIDLAARAQDPAERDALARAGLFLESNPWLSEKGGWTLEALRAYKVRARDVDQGAVLVFGDAEVDATRSVAVDASPADVKTLLTPTALAAIVAGAAGADAAAIQLGGATRVIPAAPRLTSLSGIAPSFEAAKLDLARLTTGADVALRQGRANEADAALSGILEALPEAPDGALGCVTHAPLIHGRVVVQQLNAGDPGERREELRTACSADNGGVPELVTLFGLLAALEQGHGKGGASARASWGEHIAASEGNWTSRQRAIVDALVGARSAPDASSCDGLRPTPTAGEDKLNQTLAALGRPDLTLAHDVRRVILDPPREGAERAINARGVRAWLVSQRDPERAWLGLDAVGVALDAAPTRPSAHDRLALGAVCAIYQDQLIGQLRSDRAEGAGWRASELLVSSVWRGRHCPDGAGLRPLLDAALEGASAHPDGRVALLRLLGAVAFTGAFQVVSGNSDTAIAIVVEQVDALQKIKATLGDSQEDRVLRALLDVVARPIDQLADPAATYKILMSSLATLDQITAEPTQQDSQVVFAAPAVRLVLTGLGGAYFGMFGNTQVGVELLQREARTLDADIARTLEVFDMDTAGAKPLTRYVFAAMSLMQAMNEGSSPALMNALGVVDARGMPAGWWRVAGHVSAIAIHAGALAVSRTAGDLDLEKVARVAIAREASALAADALADFDVAGTGWEVLRLTAPMADVLIGSILSDKEDAFEDALAEALPALEPHAKEALAAIKAADDSRRAPDLITVMMAALGATLEVGAENILVDGELAPAAAKVLADAMTRESQGAAPDLVVVVESLRAILLAKADPVQARAAIDSARAASSGATRTELAIPVIASLIVERDATSGASAQVARLAELDAQMRAESATRCTADLLSRTLAPYRALKLDQAGDAAEAAATRRAWFDALLAKQRVDARISIKVAAQRGNISANLDLGYPTWRLLHPEANTDDGDEGTFQIGLGYGASSAYKQTLETQIEATNTRRAAVVWAESQALLEHSLLYADDTTLSADLQRVQAVLLDPELANQMARVDTSAVTWIAFAAAARGFWRHGAMLEGFQGQTLVKESGALDALRAKHTSLAAPMDAFVKADASALQASWPKEPAFARLELEQVKRALSERHTFADRRAIGADALMQQSEERHVALIEQELAASRPTEAAIQITFALSASPTPEIVATVKDAIKVLTFESAPYAVMVLGGYGMRIDALGLDLATRIRIAEEVRAHDPMATLFMTNLYIKQGDFAGARSALRSVSVDANQRDPKNAPLLMGALEIVAAVAAEEPVDPLLLGTLDELLDASESPLPDALSGVVKALIEAPDNQGAQKDAARTAFAKTMAMFL